MEEEKQFSIDLRPDIAEGKYSNLAVISHSRTEFTLDFAQMLPGLPKAHVVQRVIMAPEHAKRLLAALQDNIAKYESAFGEIDLSAGARKTFNLADFQPNGSTKS